jgi:uncharacterized repeat protein (TIGR03803 family)
MGYYKAIAGAAFALSACWMTAAPVSAAQYQVIHNFCTQRTCADGEVPRNGLVMDAAGNLYGTASAGGTENKGTAFELIQTNGKWREKRLHNFCQVGGGGCDDGSSPQSALIMDAAGNLYGTTEDGGSGHQGAIFEILHQNGGRGYKLLQSFHPGQGESPTTGLTYVGAATGAPYDGASPLYGTAGGGAHGQGVAYELTKGPGGRWSLTTIHDFCSLANCADGSGTESELISDANGNLYGTTNTGGAHGQGVVFELSNVQGVWSETVLHDFCAQANCADGGNFYGTPLIGFAPGLVMDATGNLFGATSGGGAVKQGCCGVLYKLAPNGNAFTYSVLYDFCSLNACLDGASPEGGLTLDANGNLFGFTYSGGGNNADPDHLGGGTLYEFSGSTLTTLHAFCAQTNCADGAYPFGIPVLDASGTLFGMTEIGGVNGYLPTFSGGTAFELTP